MWRFKFSTSGSLLEKKSFLIYFTLSNLITAQQDNKKWLYETDRLQQYFLD